MKNTFTLSDIALMKNSFDNATIAHDCLPMFLNSYDWKAVYETEDNSLVFAAGGESNIDVEFFNFNHPLKRTASIMYWDNHKPTIINFG